MSNTELSRRKQRLLEMEASTRKKIEQKSDSLEKDVLKALKAGLIVGGVLFAGYQVTRMLTSNSSKEARKEKPEEKITSHEVVKAEPSVVQAALSKSMPVLTGFLFQLALKYIQKSLSKDEPNTGSADQKN